MDVAEALLASQDDIVNEAYEGLKRYEDSPYHAAGEEFTRHRLANMFRLVVACIRDRELVPMIRYAEAVALDRFDAGFDISEVQTAFNVLEEAMWRHLVATVPADELVEAIGLLGTVLGAGKDALARCYVSLASHRHVPSLNLGALFEGRTSDAQPPAGRT